MPISHTQQSYIDEIRAYAATYDESENFFKGHVEEIYASAKVRQLLAKSGLTDLDAINFAKIPVKAMTNRLEITAVTASAGENGADLSDIVNAVWDRNLMGFFTPDTHLKTAYLGDCYIFVWPVKDDNENVVNVDIRVNSPQTTRVFYDPEDPLFKVAAAKVWTFEEDGKPRSRVNFYYPDRIEKYITDPNADGKGAKPDDWMKYIADGTDPESWLVPNPYGEVPVFHHRTDFPYGIDSPDHKDAFVPQVMINKLVISHASVIDFQNFPQRFLLLDPTGDDTFGGADSDTDFPSDSDNDPENPYNSSRFRADPGEVWVATARSAGQFAAATPDTFIAPFNRYVLAMAQVTETPIHEFDPSGNPPSGESLKVAEAPLVNRCNARKLIEGSAWVDMWTFILELYGHEGAVVNVSWRNSASNPGKDDWELAEKKIEMGVPREVVLAEMGYKPDDIKTWTFGPANWLDARLLIDLINAGALTPGPELEKYVRVAWELPAHNSLAPYGKPDPNDLDMGTVWVDERRAAIGLPPLPNGEGKKRATAAASEGGGGTPPGNPLDNHLNRLLDAAQQPGKSQQPMPMDQEVQP
jgi:hypothetical protein